MASAAAAKYNIEDVMQTALYCLCTYESLPSPMSWTLARDSMKAAEGKVSLSAPVPSLTAAAVKQVLELQ
jgi:hypothetical protein